jgi:hypothetical protein
MTRRPLLLSLAFALSAVLPAAAITYPTELGTAISQSTDPYRQSGLLSFQIGGGFAQGTATVVAPKSGLTCGHVLYSPDAGYSTNMQLFVAMAGQSSLADVHVPKKKTVSAGTSPIRVFILSGYQAKTLTRGDTSPAAFARDLGGIRFRGNPNVPSFAQWSIGTEILPTNAPVISLGYGAMYHGSETYGLKMLQSSGRGPFQAIKGQAYWHNSTYLIEGGMSGGPTYTRINGQWRIIAINVSGSSFISGYRAIDEEAAEFIETYLTK